MELSNLPIDLVEEILSKLSATSLRAMRLTCKKLNTSFGEKHINSAEESMLMIVMDYKVYLMDINLHDIHNIVDLSIKRKGELISLNGLDDHIVGISQIFHCDGLLLCVTKEENKRLVVWNPYTAETKWIEPINPYHRFDRYAIGYGKRKTKNRSLSIHKILRFNEDDWYTDLRCEIYDLKTDSWRVLKITRAEWYLYRCSVSLKGNTYWILRRWGQDILFLICFDFTRERFGPGLSLPFKYNAGDNMALSTVREDQLVVLAQRLSTMEIEIWVTCKIEPETVLWNKSLFLAVDTRPFSFQIRFQDMGFFIDEEKKIDVLMDRNEDNTRHIAYIIGENGYIKQVDLGEVTDNSCKSSCYVRISRNLKGNSMSLKGNTYWIAGNAERFGPCLSLPFKYNAGDNVGLSSVREEQLVVLMQRGSTMKMEIWVTSNIEPETVLWNNKLFLAVDIVRPSTDLRFQINFRRNSFFIDEEEKIVVVMAKNKEFTRQIAYIIGENGYIKQVDLGEVRNIACNSCITRNLQGNIMF